MKRGKAPPVDNRSGWVLSHEVLVTDDGVWDATLNQTDVGNNANKYVPRPPYCVYTPKERASAQVLRVAAPAPRREQQPGDALHMLGPRRGERPEPEEGESCAGAQCSVALTLVVPGPVAAFAGHPRVQEAVQGQGRCRLGTSRWDGPEEGYVRLGWRSTSSSC